MGAGNGDDSVMTDCNWVMKQLEKKADSLSALMHEVSSTFDVNHDMLDQADVMYNVMDAMSDFGQYLIIAKMFNCITRSPPS